MGALRWLAVPLVSLAAFGACLNVGESDTPSPDAASGGSSGSVGLTGGATFGGGSGGGDASSDANADGGPPPFAVSGVVFDGIEDWLDLASSFAATNDGYSVTGSMWFLRHGLATTYCIGPEAAGSSAPNQLEWNTANQFRINWRKAGGGIACDFVTSAITDTSSWHHIAFSIDLTSLNTRHLFVDGVSDLTSTDYPAVAMDNTGSQWGLFADNGGSQKYDGSVAEFWLALNQYLDLGNPDNLLKFRSADGKPVDLGADGSLPTGIAPTIYLSLRPGQDAAEFAVNRGSGGGFTVQGTLDVAPSSPSD